MPLGETSDTHLKAGTFRYLANKINELTGVAQSILAGLPITQGIPWRVPTQSKQVC